MGNWIGAVDMWFKTTVPGIVLLGVAGSLIAAALLKLLRRYLAPVLVRVVGPWLRPFVLARVLALKYVILKDQGKLTYLIVISVAGFCASYTLLIAGAGAYAVYVTQNGFPRTGPTLSP